MSGRCPREDPLEKVKPDQAFEVPCPECGAEVEFMAREDQVRCPNCGNMVPNPRQAAGPGQSRA